MNKTFCAAICSCLSTLQIGNGNTRFLEKIEDMITVYGDLYTFGNRSWRLGYRCQNSVIARFREVRRQEAISKPINDGFCINFFSFFIFSIYI